MLQRSAHTHEGPLTAEARDLPAARRRRSRRRVAAASVGVALLAASAALIAAMSLSALRVIPAPTLTPVAAPAEPAAPEETPAPADGIRTDVLSGQDVWLALPAAEPVGVAYLLPDATDDPQDLLQDAAAAALISEGWAVATGDLGGLSWGSPAATASLAELRAWAESEVGEPPALYVGAGMGSTTALTSLVRQPALPVGCWYAIAPITDLATLVGARPDIGDQIATAWNGIPSADENPLLQTANLPLATTYRIVTPSAPQERVDDANTFVAALEDSGHTVTSVVAPENATPASLRDDLTSFAKGCRA